MLCGEREGGWSAPVVTDQEKALLAGNVVNQTPHVIGERLFVVSAGRPGRIAQPAQIRSDHPVALRQAGQDLAPHVPGLRPAVQEDDRSALPGGDVVEPDVAQIGEIMDERLRHEKDSDWKS